MPPFPVSNLVFPTSPFAASKPALSNIRSGLNARNAGNIRFSIFFKNCTRPVPQEPIFSFFDEEDVVDVFILIGNGLIGIEVVEEEEEGLEEVVVVVVVGNGDEEEEDVDVDEVEEDELVDDDGVAIVILDSILRVIKKRVQNIYIVNVNKKTCFEYVLKNYRQTK